MWRLLVPFVLRFASALPAVRNGTVTCPHDALYTSLIGNGTQFCSSLLDAAHCGGGYSTPPSYMTFNQTRLSSYCQCIMTNRSVTAVPTGSWNVTLGEPTATTRDPGSETSGATSTETGGPPGARPGPGDPSTSEDFPTSTVPGSATGRGGVSSFSPGDEDSSTTSRPASFRSVTSSTSGGSIGASSVGADSSVSGAETTGSQGNVSSETGAGATTGPSSRTPSALSNATHTSSEVPRTDQARPGPGSSSTVPGGDTTSLGSPGPRSSTFSGWNASMTEPVGSGSVPGSLEGSVTQFATGIGTGGRTGTIPTETSSDIPRSSANSTQTGSDTATDQSSTSEMGGSPGTHTGTVPDTASHTNSITETGASNGTYTGTESATYTGTGPTTVSGTTSNTETGVSGRTQRGTSSVGSGSATGSGGTISVSGSQTHSGITSGATPTGFPRPGLNSTSLGLGNFSVTAFSPTHTGFPNVTSSAGGNATATSVSEFPAANFTRVTRTAAVSQETCYRLPQDPERDPTRRALLRNSRLRQQNATIPWPYIESVDFESDGVDPLFMTIRDTEEGTHFLDLSNQSQIAVVDRAGNSMLLDPYGFHFTTNSCDYTVSITVKNLYQQLASLAGASCSIGGSKKRMDDMDFVQVVNLHDQCGNPVTRAIRPYPHMAVGDTECTNTDVEEDTGRWEFDCTFPGSFSGSLRCQWAIKNDVVDFLLTDPFGGACPDLSTVITTLEASGRDFLSADSLRTELYNQGLGARQRQEADAAVAAYVQLWEVLQQSFSKSRMVPPGNSSAIERYINLYNSYRDFEDDICEDLHAGEVPLKLSLVAGSTRIDAITTLNWAPESPRVYNITVQDSSEVACCANGSVANDDGGTCEYPPSARIRGTGCVCGRTVDRASIAFEFTECDNYVSGCESDADCGRAGYPSYVCLTGTCCGGGVCVDPFACSQNGTMLVPSR